MQPESTLTSSSSSTFHHCDRCGTEFQVNKNRTRFCSRKCYEGESIYLICIHCGTEFRRTPSRFKKAGDGKYCSKACHQNATSVENTRCTCARCGAPFDQKPSQLKRRGRGQYCSKACFYGPRVERTCEQCGNAFFVKPSTLTKHAGSGGKYCSKACMYLGLQVFYTCKSCGKKYLRQGHGAQYCSQKCSGLAQQNRITKQCKECNADFTTNLHNQIYCSRLCQRTFRTRVGKVICKNCGKVFHSPPSNKTQYCSHPCWLKAMMTWRGTTVIEQAVYDALTELSIQFEREVVMGPYIVDVYIPICNTVIECQGDFWHCNPAIYTDGPKTDVQRENIDRDAQKLVFLEEQEYNIIYLWEADIKTIGAKALLEQAFNERCL